MFWYMNPASNLDSVRIRQSGRAGNGVLQGVSVLYSKFLLDFRKDNLVILVIRSLFPYQGLVIPYRGLMFLRHMKFGH